MLQLLAVRQRARRQQPDRRPGLADRAAAEPRRARDGGERGQRRRLHVGLRDRGGAGRQQRLEQPQLGGAIGAHGAVVVEVVAGQVGEAGGGQPHAVQPALVEPVRRGLHRRMLDAGPRRAAPAVRASATGSGVVRPGAGSKPGAIRPERAQAGGLAARPASRSGAGTRPCWSCRWCRSRRPPLPAGSPASAAAIGPGGGAARLVLQQRTRRHAGRPDGALRCQHRRGAARHRIGDEGAAVDPAAGQRGEQVAGRDRAAVGGDAGDLQASAPARKRNADDRRPGAPGA